MVGVLTYNIHSGVGGDGVYDLERIAGVVRRSGADVVCLQEVQSRECALAMFERSLVQVEANGEVLRVRKWSVPHPGGR